MRLSDVRALIRANFDVLGGVIYYHEREIVLIFLLIAYKVLFWPSLYRPRLRVNPDPAVTS
jgi:hypothetical protein